MLDKETQDYLDALRTFFGDLLNDAVLTALAVKMAGIENQHKEELCQRLGDAAVLRSPELQESLAQLRRGELRPARTLEEEHGE